MNEPETVSGHMYRMAIMSFLFDDDDDVDRDRWVFIFHISIIVLKNHLVFLIQGIAEEYFRLQYANKANTSKLVQKRTTCH